MTPPTSSNQTPSEEMQKRKIEKDVAALERGSIIPARHRRIVLATYIRSLESQCSTLQRERDSYKEDAERLVEAMESVEFEATIACKLLDEISDVWMEEHIDGLAAKDIPNVRINNSRDIAKQALSSLKNQYPSFLL